MSFKISVPVLYDGNKVYLANRLTTVDSLSKIVGPVQMPSGRVIPGFAPSSYTTTLQIKEPTLGVLYLSITLTQWQQLCVNANAQEAGTPGAIPSGSSSKVLTYTIGTDKPAGATITDPALMNVTLLEIWIDGASYDIRTIPYGPAGGDLTFSPALVNDQTVSILCYNN